MLSRPQRHPACSHLIRKIVFYPILDFEIAACKVCPVRSALRPDVAQAIGSPQLQRDEGERQKVGGFMRLEYGTGDTIAGRFLRVRC